MLQFDATKWRNLGLDAELTALLVACVNAANRTGKTGTPGRGISSVVSDPGGGLRVQLTDGTEILLDTIRANLAADDAASVAAALNEAAALRAAIDRLPLSMVDLDIETGRLIKIMADGTRLTGPVLPVGEGPIIPDPPAETGWVAAASPGTLTIVGMPAVPEIVASVENNTIIIEGYSNG